MKPNYTLLALLCMGLSVPLLYLLANRDRAGGAPGVRFATFNVALHRDAPSALLEELRRGDCEPALRIAEVVQRVRPDVLLLQELDRDYAAEAARVFQELYLGRPLGGREAVRYEFSYCGAVNTGVASGLDLDGDGAVGGAGDAFGYGAFEGQYGMVLLSRYPILVDRVRTFRTLRWSAMPDALRPEGCYTDEVWQQLRLSSKSHWDVPIGIGDPATGTVVHALCSHPTPPVFDGPEDRNGCRNHDEIRFWSDYLAGGERAAWIVDDAGVAGGLERAAECVVLGDLNCDPSDGDGRRAALLALLADPRLADPEPRSDGGPEQAVRQFGANARHQGNPALDTADFDDTVGAGPGNLRVDYVLPSRGLLVVASGVVWPRAFDPWLERVAVSDHRLVWVDCALPMRGR